ncbi:hypothetical protein BRCON_2840 [Candidatus Sumerlaea chitinivorans]|uniref:Uncharacterized protein n=1 Tax=Sumerlaea chitinivorans TaxID=2250252 RepID=A0A2Z4YAF8_SUMC1|nr:hypothetical protein BRCON_2840 [Candidatus Sumerlaea chitinivorans]
MVFKSCFELFNLRILRYHTSLATNFTRRAPDAMPSVLFVCLAALRSLTWKAQSDPI